MIRTALAASLACSLAAGPDTRKVHTGSTPKVLAFVQTSASGDHCKPMPFVRFTKGTPNRGAVVRVFPGIPRQTLQGIGGALTESSAFVLAHLSKDKREAILDRCFKPQEANFTMARTPIGACDFCVTGKYSYADTPGDVALEHFSIAPDQQGFKGVPDSTYALLPLIKDALTRQPDLKLIASPWTAPAWMKDNHDWYGHGKGGKLLPEHYDTFARYMVKYLEAYQAKGVRIWGVTPVNEPLGNGGQWESMEFTDGTMREYLKEHLGPQLRNHGFSGVKILNFDHNRDANALKFAETILGDPATAPYVWGTGLHWYSSTTSANPEIMDTLHRRFPTKEVLHTEGCIDGIGTEDSSPQGHFLGWKNDTWWWSGGATDWGYYWASPEEKPLHPKYAPVHRYARDLIEGLNHWFVGWIDWNLVLDKRGGPNHVGNFCGAPIMVDTVTEEVYFTPLFYVMSHFSHFLQPGDRIVQVATTTPGLDTDDFRATAAISKDKKSCVVIVFNKSPQAVSYVIQVEGFHAPVTIPKNALQTMSFKLGR
ncbi:MAG: glycoside hydrolase family 30 beta sandwich domain-containing protein [Holophaga sp.]